MESLIEFSPTMARGDGAAVRLLGGIARHAGDRTNRQPNKQISAEFFIWTNTSPARSTRRSPRHNTAASLWDNVGFGTETLGFSPEITAWPGSTLRNDSSRPHRRRL